MSKNKTREDKATPRPWRFDLRHDVIKGPNEEIIAGDCDYERGGICLREGDIELIVQAVNERDSLLKAIRDLRGAINTYLHCIGCGKHDNVLEDVLSTTKQFEEGK